MNLTTTAVVSFEDRSFRHRDMVQCSCPNCGAYAMESTNDHQAKCLLCGYKLPRWMTKAGLAAHCAVEGETT